MCKLIATVIFKTEFPGITNSKIKIAAVEDSQVRDLKKNEKLIHCLNRARLAA